MEFNIILLILLFYLLGNSSQWVVNSLIELGTSLRISRFIMGLVILAIATSISELLVGLNSIATGVPTLSLGNVLGASLVLLSLIAGLGVILNKKVNIFRAIKINELFIFNAVIVLPGILILDGMLSRIDGLILMSAFAGHIFYIISKKTTNHIDTESPKRKKAGEKIGFLILGLLVMTLAAKYAVDIGSQIALDLGIAPLIIGVTVFSLGTNLPELFIVFNTRTETKKLVLFGDLLGSSAANSLIIGLVAFFSPFVVQDMASTLLTVFFLFGGVIVFDLFAISNKNFDRKEGFLLIAVYAAFIITSVVSNLV